MQVNQKFNRLYVLGINELRCGRSWYRHKVVTVSWLSFQVLEDTAEAKRVLGEYHKLKGSVLVADSNNDQVFDPYTGKSNGQPLPPGNLKFLLMNL